MQLKRNTPPHLDSKLFLVRGRQVLSFDHGQHLRRPASRQPRLRPAAAAWPGLRSPLACRLPLLLQPRLLLLLLLRLLLLLLLLALAAATATAAAAAALVCSPSRRAPGRTSQHRAVVRPNNQSEIAQPPQIVPRLPGVSPSRFGHPCCFRSWRRCRRRRCWPRGGSGPSRALGHCRAVTPSGCGALQLLLLLLPPAQRGREQGVLV